MTVNSQNDKISYKSNSMKSYYSFAIAFVLAAVATPIWAAPADNLPILDWPTQRGLNVTFTLESSRLKTSELVAAVATQTKVRLNLPAELQNRALVLRANKMPLSELLPALSQIYGLEWTRDKAPDSFSARQTATPTEVALLQLGEINQLRDRVRIEATKSEHATIEAARALEPERLAQGVAVSELPANLYQSLQIAKQQRAALNYLTDFAPWTPFQLRQMRVRVALPRANKAGIVGAPQFVLADAGGKTLRNLGAMELPSKTE